MSDLIKAEDNAGTPIQGEAPQYSETERSAMEQGWMPLDKWTEAGRDASEHRTAREFKDRGELLKRIQDQNKHIKGMADSFETLRQHNARTFEAAYKKAVVDLKAAHAAAVNEGDIAKAEQLVDQISTEKENFIRGQAANAVAQQQVPQVSPEVEQWKSANTWYDDDEDLRVMADGFGFKFIQANQGKVAPDQVLKHVSKKMEKYLPAKNVEATEQQRITAPNPVGDSRGAIRQQPSGVVGLREGDLSEEETKGMKDFVKWGLGTKTDYLKQIKTLRG